MPNTNVKSRWVNGDLVFYDKSNNEIFRIDGTNRKLTFASGAVFDVAAATGTILFAAAEIAQADIVAASLDGTVAATVANANVIGALPVLYRIDIAAGSNGDTDVILTHKTRVVDAWVVLTGAGVTSAVLTVKNGATAITDGMAASGADKTVSRAGTIDDAQHEIAAAGTLRVTGSGGATQPAATVYVLGVRVA